MTGVQTCALPISPCWFGWHTLSFEVALWPTDGTGAFVRTVARAITEAAASRADKLAETAKGLFRHLTPTLTFDESGQAVLQFGARSGAEREPEPEDVLEAPARVAEREKRRSLSSTSSSGSWSISALSSLPSHMLQTAYPR